MAQEVTLVVCHGLAQKIEQKPQEVCCGANHPGTKTLCENSATESTIGKYFQQDSSTMHFFLWENQWNCTENSTERLSVVSGLNPFLESQCGAAPLQGDALLLDTI